jgi:hypothetical protein
MRWEIEVGADDGGSGLAILGSAYVALEAFVIAI